MLTRFNNVANSEGKTTYRRADGYTTNHLWGSNITEDAEYADAPQVPVPALDTDTPEISLLCALLERTILDLGGRGNENGTARASTVVNALEAFEWVADPGEDVWSFVWVCDHLLLSVSATRQRIFVMATQLRHASLTRTNGGWRAPQYRSPA